MPRRGIPDVWTHSQAKRTERDSTRQGGMILKKALRIAGLAVSTAASIVTIARASRQVAYIALPSAALLGILVVAWWIWDRRKARSVGVSVGFLRGPYEVRPASTDDIRWIAETAKRVYRGLDVIPAARMIEWHRANPDGFSIIVDRWGHRCGNIDILPLKPTAMAGMIRGDMIEQEIGGDALFAPAERDQVEALYVESFVAVNPDCTGNAFAAYKGIVRAPSLIERISNPERIRRIYAIGASVGGVRLLEDLGFDAVESETPRRDHHSIYVASFSDLARNIAACADNADRRRLKQMLTKASREPTL